VRLQGQPALGIDAKEGAQARGGVGGDRSVTLRDLVDAPARHVNRFGQRVLTDP